MNDNNIPTDWDQELVELLEASGIDPATATRPDPRAVLPARVKNAKAAIAGVVIATPVMIAAAVSGAPTAAVAPLWGWGVGWIGYGVWISAGRPRPGAVTSTGVLLLGRAWELVLRAVMPHLVGVKAAVASLLVGRDRVAATPVADAPPF